MKTIAFWNRKGGTGKTTTAGNVARELSVYGRTLAVDVDPQSNLTGWLATDPGYELADVLNGSVSLQDAVTPVRDSLDILGSFAIGGELQDWTESRLYKAPYAFTDLRQSVQNAGYQYMVLDLATGSSLKEQHALSIADTVVLITAPEVFSLDGLESARETLQQVQDNLRGRFDSNRMLVNRVNRSYTAHRSVLEAFEGSGYQIYNVGQSTDIHDCVGAKMTLAEYAPGNQWTTTYVMLAKDLK